MMNIAAAQMLLGFHIGEGTALALVKHDHSRSSGTIIAPERFALGR